MPGTRPGRDLGPSCRRSPQGSSGKWNGSMMPLIPGTDFPWGRSSSPGNPHRQKSVCSCTTGQQVDAWIGQDCDEEEAPIGHPPIREDAWPTRREDLYLHWSPVPRKSRDAPSDTGIPQDSGP